MPLHLMTTHQAPNTPTTGLEERNFKCLNKCSRMFGSKQLVRKHYRKKICKTLPGKVPKSKKDRNVKCLNRCSQMFINRRGAGKHFRKGLCTTLPGEMPATRLAKNFECPNQCSFKFTTSVGARKHLIKGICTPRPGKALTTTTVDILSIRPKTCLSKEKKFKCLNRCGKMFGWPYLAREHAERVICMTALGKALLVNVEVATTTGRVWLTDTVNPLIFGIMYEEYWERYELILVIFDTSSLRFKKKPEIVGNLLSNVADFDAGLSINDLGIDLDLDIKSDFNGDDFEDDNMIDDRDGSESEIKGFSTTTCS
jgi:hypothetical protein